jgi:hypothetical protein
MSSLSYKSPGVSLGAAALAVGALVAAGTAPASAATAVSVWETTADGSQLQQWACTSGDTAQAFTLTPQS